MLRFVLLNELFLHIFVCIMADDGVGSRIPFYARCQVGSKQKVPETNMGPSTLVKKLRYVHNWLERSITQRK